MKKFFSSFKKKGPVISAADSITPVLQNITVRGNVKDSYLPQNIWKHIISLSDRDVLTKMRMLCTYFYKLPAIFNSISDVTFSKYDVWELELIDWPPHSGALVETNTEISGMIGIHNRSRGNKSHLEWARCGFIFATLGQFVCVTLQTNPSSNRFTNALLRFYRGEDGARFLHGSFITTYTEHLNRQETPVEGKVAGRIHPDYKETFPPADKYLPATFCNLPVIVMRNDEYTGSWNAYLFFLDEGRTCVEKITLSFTEGVFIFEVPPPENELVEGAKGHGRILFSAHSGFLGISLIRPRPNTKVRRDLNTIAIVCTTGKNGSLVGNFTARHKGLQIQGKFSATKSI